ncbi:expressed unknown protein [Seminavis robusta]|uniref:DUF6824 domain-containing protein n=1 Tax=Seminavis robusta TaxID=568900 RepID=A0A9N8EJM6_9STRA|nr:expressed unknown protein [Seminavis robusta]|eukprot:Sro1063_g237160.1 n/a (363) ;mRNA; f:34155-35600
MSAEVAALPLTGIKHPGINDVMFGRGGETNYHIGNHRFRVLADEHRSSYRGSSRKDKAIVVHEVVRIWRERKGRFLTKTDPEKGDDSLWHDVGDEVAKKKAAKILSEKSSSRQRGKAEKAGADGGNGKRPAENSPAGERPCKIRAVDGAISANVAATTATAAASTSLAMPQSAATAAWIRQSALLRGQAQLPPSMQLPAAPQAARLPPNPLQQLAGLATPNNLLGGGLSTLDLLRLRNNPLAMPTTLPGTSIGALPCIGASSLPPRALAAVADALVAQEEQQRAVAAASTSRTVLANSILMRNLTTLQNGNPFAAAASRNNGRSHLGLSAEQLKQLVRDSQPAGSGRDPEECKRPADSNGKS